MKNMLELIAELKGKLTAVELPEETRDLIGQIYSQGEEILSSLRNANAEAKDSRLKVTALEKEKAQLTADLDAEKQAHQKTKDDHANADKELTGLREIKALKDKELSDKWTEAMKVFDVKETDPNFKKIQDAKEFFVFPKDDKTPLTPDEVSANLTAFDRLSKIGALGEVKQEKKPDGKKSGGQQSSDSDSDDNVSSLFEEFDS